MNYFRNEREKSIVKNSKENIELKQSSILHSFDIFPSTKYSRGQSQLIITPERNSQIVNLLKKTYSQPFSISSPVPIIDQKSN